MKKKLWRYSKCTFTFFFIFLYIYVLNDIYHIFRIQEYSANLYLLVCECLLVQNEMVNWAKSAMDTKYNLIKIIKKHTFQCCVVRFLIKVEMMFEYQHSDIFFLYVQPIKLLNNHGRSLSKIFGKLHPSL